MNSILKSLMEKAVGNCQVHGDFETPTFTGRPPPCPTCAELGIRDRQAKARESAAPTDRLLSASGVPLRYRGARIEHVATPYREKLSKWADRAENRYAPLLMIGNVGTGKTYAAAAVIRAMSEHGVQALFGSEADYLREIRASWDSKDITEQSVFRRWAGAHVLFLDDIGAARGNENDAMRLHELIATRYNNLRTTAFISNLTPEALRDAVGERAYDRMRDGATQMTMTGPSRRKAA
ncbi:ATP-binding protein [Panacagrimonas sp.]|uniref:ATP-binding protein n=1 Tax=Panacagrimonas sp. TaxID=2480088 RepID=UPI003B5290EA